MRPHTSQGIRRRPRRQPKRSRERDGARGCVLRTTPRCQLSTSTSRPPPPPPPAVVGKSSHPHGAPVFVGPGCLGASRSPDEWSDDRLLGDQSRETWNSFHETSAMRRERCEVVPGEPGRVAREREHVRREGRRIQSEWSAAGETGPEDASRCRGHCTPGPVSLQGAERDGRPLSAGPRGPISRARTGKDFFPRTGTLTVPAGHVSTGLSALQGELPALPMAR